MGRRGYDTRVHIILFYGTTVFLIANIPFAISFYLRGRKGKTYVRALFILYKDARALLFPP